MEEVAKNCFVGRLLDFAPLSWMWPPMECEWRVESDLFFQ